MTNPKAVAIKAVEQMMRPRKDDLLAMATYFKKYDADEMMMLYDGTHTRKEALEIASLRVTETQAAIIWLRSLPDPQGD